VLRSSIPGEAEQLFEVDQYIQNYMLSLVGAYSTRRRIDFRIERKSKTSKIVMKVDYPAYGGRLASLIDRVTARRKLATALVDSLVHFKGLVEFERHPVAVGEPLDPGELDRLGAVKLTPGMPVSYTHLRAHATPEHLVCRPLLEKKKPSSKEPHTH